MCSQCQAVFKYPNSLKGHMRCHCKKRSQNSVAENTTFESQPLFRTNIKSYDTSTDEKRILGSAFSNARSTNYVRQSPPVHVKIEQEKPISPQNTTQSDRTPPIQIFNHIHTPPAVPMSLDYMALSYYYSQLQHQARIPMNYMPYLSSAHHFSRMSGFHSTSPPTSSSHEPWTANHKFTASRQTMPHSPSPVTHSRCRSVGDETVTSNRLRSDSLTPSAEAPGVSESDRRTAADIYNIPLLSAKEGEPLDMLPRSLYMNKSRKGHICVYCGKLYSRKYGLKIHLRTHTGYKPLKCKVCLRPFGDPSNLNKHIRLHAEGETPYRCKYCSKVLVRRRDLERHINSRHPDKVGEPGQHVEPITEEKDKLLITKLEPVEDNNLNDDSTSDESMDGDFEDSEIEVG